MDNEKHNVNAYFQDEENIEEFEEYSADEEELHAEAEDLDGAYDEFGGDEYPEDILGPDPETDEPRIEIIVDPLISKAYAASEFLRGVMLRMGLSGRIATTIRHGAIYLEITGAEPGLVIGHRGQNLDALQHLVNRMVNKQSQDIVSVTVDSDEYRSRRHNQLEQMVRTIANEVMGNGVPVVTEPLTPSERRLFHIAADQLKGVHTESFGSGFFQPIKVSSAGVHPREAAHYRSHEYRNPYSRDDH